MLTHHSFTLLLSFSLSLSSAHCHWFPLSCLLVLCTRSVSIFACLSVSLWLSDTGITSSINSPPCPHPRLSPWHSFSSSYLLHTGSISTSAAVEARLLPVVNFSLPPTYTHIDRAILSSLFVHSSSLIARCMNSVCVFLLGTFSGKNTDCVGASSPHRD